MRHVRQALRGSDPVDTFLLFFDDGVMNQFIIATNGYGNRFIQGWSGDVTISEFRKFLAIILCLGMTKFPNREKAWEKSPFGHSFIPSQMTLRRFNQILRAWHFENYANLDAAEILRVRYIRFYCIFVNSNWKFFKIDELMHSGL